MGCNSRAASHRLHVTIFWLVPTITVFRIVPAIVLRFVPVIVFKFPPVRNGDRVIRELTRGDERPNVFLERSRWLEPLHENILQAGQHSHYSAFTELLQCGRDTWCK